MLVALPGAAAQDRKARTEADLEAVNSRIERIRQQVQRDAVEKDRLNRDLKAAERSVSSARSELSRVQKERAERDARAARLSQERAQREARAGENP